MKWLDGITDLMDMSLSKLREWTGKPGMLQSMGLQKLDMTERLDWTEVLKPGIVISVERLWVLARFVSQPNGLKSQSGFWLGSSPSTWVQDPV